MTRIGSGGEAAPARGNRPASVGVGKVAPQRVQYGDMRRIAWLLLILIVVPVLAGTPPPTLQLNARAAILMDRRSGLVLWSFNPDLALPMASTTKIMTAMVILDRGTDRLDEPVTVSRHAFEVASGGSSQFAAGTVVKLGDLLTAALVMSSNEATTAAAEHLAGDEQTFVGWMNDKAKELGLTHTHFTSPHGFTRPRFYRTDHYSSARDLATMARCALTRYPRIRELVAIKDTRVVAMPRGAVSLHSSNHLLGREVPGIPGSRVDGVKTGFIRDSGYCYVGSATVNGWQLIAVCLNDKDRFKDAATLFHYGFSRYDWKTYAGSTLPCLEVPVVRGAVRRVAVGADGTLGAPMPKSGEAPVRDQVRFTGKRPRAPVRRGERIGTLTLYRNDRPVVAMPAIALSAVPVAWWVRAVTILCCALISLSLLAIIGALYGTRAKNARRRRRELAAARRRAD